MQVQASASRKYAIIVYFQNFGGGIDLDSSVAFNKPLNDDQATGEDEVEPEVREF